MVVLVKLRIALRCHTGMTHHDVHTVRNVDFHFPSGKGTLVNPQTVAKVVRNTRCIRAAHLTFSGERVQNFVLCVGAEAPLKVD